MRRDAGLTLVEVLIASVILSAVMIMTLNILLTGSTQVQRESIGQGLDQRGRQIQNGLGGDLVTARFNLDWNDSVTGLRSMNPFTVAGIGSTNLGIYAGNSELRYMIAGTQDQTGRGPGTSPTIKSGQIVWGGLLPSNGGTDPFRQDLAYLIRFEASTVILEGGFSAVVTGQPSAYWTAPFQALPAPTSILTINKDLDGNGSTADTFVMGKLCRYLVAPVGHPASPTGGILSSESLDDNVVLKVAGSNLWNGDMDASTPGSGILFQFIDSNGAAAMSGNNPSSAAVAVKITVWHGSQDDRQKDFWLRKSSWTVRFRNPQS